MSYGIVDIIINLEIRQGIIFICLYGTVNILWYNNIIMTKIINIAKNTSYLTIALILQKVISFTYFAILARNLGPENLGKYYFAISLTTIFAIFIDMGMVNALTREVAKSENRAKDLLGNVLIIKIPLAILSLAAVAILINIMGYPLITMYLVYLSSICMILDSFTLTFFGVIRGFHNLKFESIASVIFQIIVIIFGLSALYAGLGLLWVMSALVGASLFNFVYSGFVLWKKWKIKIIPRYNKDLIKFIIKLSIPFGLFAIFQRIYTYIDTVFLSIYAGDKYVGLYQVAFKIIFALQFLPMAFMASLYPAMSTYWLKNREQLAISFERAINYLIIISLPITFGIIFLADKIILIFKSDFIEAILPMQIIIVSLLFIFINFPIGSLLNACDRQKINTTNMAIVTIVSVLLNIILIPKFQAIGASITVLATNFLMFALGIYWVPKIIKYRPLLIIKTFLKSLIACLVMAISLFYLKSFINIFIVVILGGIIYFAVLFLLKGFRKEDIISIYNSFIKKSV